MGQTCTDDVIISLAVASKFCAVSTRESFVCGKIDHFHTLCLPSWDTFFTYKVAFWSDKRLPRSTLKIIGEIGDIFGNACCLSQLKYSWTQVRVKLKSELIQTENKAYRTRQLTKYILILRNSSDGEGNYAVGRVRTCNQSWLRWANHNFNRFNDSSNKWFLS